MKLDVLDIQGQKKSEIDAPDSVFGADVKKQLIYDVVRYQLSKRRSGSAATKNRAAVRGGGIKPWRQKGTGRARAGSIRSPLWVGGGTIFGPQPRDYSFKINKKVKKGALKSALAYKVKNQDLMLVDDFELEEAKTRIAAKILRDLGIDRDTKTLILVEMGHDNLKRAIRNIPGVKVIDIMGLNVYDLMWHKKLIIESPALNKLEEAFTS